MILGVVTLTIPLLTGLAPQCGSFVAVAQPYATVDGQVRAGAVRVLDGPLITQDDPEPGDMFGSALATGDFDGDGCADLAIGASEEDAGPGGRDGHGVVEILYGLTSRKTVELPGKGADRFGAALAAGDLDGDGDDELAIGAPGGGAVYVHGQGTKPRRIKNTGGAVTDQFGEALATGDFDGDGTDELAIGAPGANLIRQGEGTVTVVAKGGRRLLYSQETYGVDGLSESWDAFGASLATGDFNADGHDDLAIGVPGEGLNKLQRAGDYGEGAVDVVYGSPGGLRPATAEAWTQNSLAGKAVMYDRFGTSLAAGDLNGDGDDELVVGVPGENAVQVLAGTRTGGLTRNHNVLIPGPKGAEFGAAVLVHDGNLIVGAPTKGAVYRYRGSVKKGSYPGVGRKGEKIAEGDGFLGFGLG